MAVGPTLVSEEARPDTSLAIARSLFSAFQCATNHSLFNPETTVWGSRIDMLDLDGPPGQSLSQVPLDVAATAALELA